MVTLAAIREVAQLSQSRLAELSGVGRSMIAHMEAGKRRPGLPVFLALVDTLKLTDTEAMTLARELASATDSAANPATTPHQEAA